jgi:hypothetical protein
MVRLQYSLKRLLEASQLQKMTTKKGVTGDSRHEISYLLLFHFSLQPKIIIHKSPSQLPTDNGKVVHSQQHHDDKESALVRDIIVIIPFTTIFPPSRE